MDQEFIKNRMLYGSVLQLPPLASVIRIAWRKASDIQKTIGTVAVCELLALATTEILP